MTIAQLTHMRPRDGKLDEVIALIQEWGEATRGDAGRPSYSFLCQDDDHLFVVSLHESTEAYNATAEANEAWHERLMPLLVDEQGPTFYGEVLAQEGTAGPEASAGRMAFPAAMRIAKRH